jgi:hypothetical protein
MNGGSPLKRVQELSERSTQKSATSRIDLGLLPISIRLDHLLSQCYLHRYTRLSCCQQLKHRLIGGRKEKRSMKKRFVSRRRQPTPKELKTSKTPPRWVQFLGHL